MLHGLVLVLAVAFIGLVARPFAPAPSNPPTELTFESEGRKVTLSLDGLVVSDKSVGARAGWCRRDTTLAPCMRASTPSPGARSRPSRRSSPSSWR